MSKTRSPLYYSRGQVVVAVFIRLSAGLHTYFRPPAAHHTAPPAARQTESAACQNGIHPQRARIAQEASGASERPEGGPVRSLRLLGRAGRAWAWPTPFVAHYSA